MCWREFPGAAAEQALRKALEQPEGNVKIGIINSLGQRGDPNAVPALRSLAALSVAGNRGCGNLRARGVSVTRVPSAVLRQFARKPLAHAGSASRTHTFDAPQRLPRTATGMMR